MENKEVMGGTSDPVDKLVDVDDLLNRSICVIQVKWVVWVIL